MIHHTQCPVCFNNAITPSFTAKDNTVSGETFEVWSCSHCETMFTQNVPSEEEIGKYYKSEDYISHSDTKKGLVNEVYHRVRTVTLSEKKKLIESETGIAAGKILDVGCGTGAFLNKMKEGGWQVTGIEPDPTARAKAAELYTIHPKSPDELGHLPEGHYDAITLWHVLEHVHRLHDYLEMIKKLLSPKGRIFIAVPNFTSADAEYYRDNWAAYDVPRHLYHFSPHSMNMLLNMHNMQIRKMKPMWFDSFYVSMLSEQYKNEKGNLAGALFSGIRSNAKALFNKQKCSSVIYIVGKD